MAICKHDGCDREAYKDKPYCSKCFNEHYKGKRKKGEETPVAAEVSENNEKPVELKKEEKPKEPKIKLGIFCGPEEVAKNEYQINFVVDVSKDGKRLSAKELKVIYVGKVVVTAQTNVNGEVSGNFKISAKPDQEVEVVFNLLDGADTEVNSRMVKMPSSPPKPYVANTSPRCPRCKSTRWNGHHCSTCNYPKRRKLII